MTDPWKDKNIANIFSKYKLNGIFNSDKFAVFCRLLPNKTNHLLDEKCSVGEKNKVKLTGVAAASVTGKK